MRRDAISDIGVAEFLASQPGMRLVPSFDRTIVIRGALNINCVFGPDHVEDTFHVEILIPYAFPNAIPSVRDLSGRIPKDFHTNPGGVLCLGTDIWLQLDLAKDPSFTGFFRNCILPYLFGRAVFERRGIMPFGELEHGSPGILHDLKSIFGVTTDLEAIEIARLASMRRRVANKLPCHCGAGVRLGRCEHRVRISQLRSLVSRSQFAKVLGDLKKK